MHEIGTTRKRFNDRGLKTHEMGEQRKGAVLGQKGRGGANPGGEQ